MGEISYREIEIKRNSEKHSPTGMMEAYVRSPSHASMLRPHRALALALLPLTLGSRAPPASPPQRSRRGPPSASITRTRFSQPQYGGYDRRYDSASPYNIQDGRVRLARGPISELTPGSAWEGGGYAQAVPLPPRPSRRGAEERAWLRGEDRSSACSPAAARGPQSAESALGCAAATVSRALTCRPLSGPRAEERTWMRGGPGYQRAPWTSAACLRTRERQFMRGGFSCHQRATDAAALASERLERQWYRQDACHRRA